MKRSNRLALVLFALIFALYGCGSSDQSSTPEQPDSSQADTFVIPDDYVVINFEESTAPDHADYGEKQQQFFADLERAIQNKTEKICTRNALPLEYMDLFALDHGVFWLKDMGTTIEHYFAQTDSDTEKTFYYLYNFHYYDLSDQEIQAMKQEIDDSASQILSKVPADADDWTAAKIIHDELCRLVTYDETTSLDYVHNVYGVLVNHMAICSGYSSAFHYLMKQLGYHSRMPYSDTHAWNWVNVRSYDQYIDTTWDDTNTVDAYGNPYIRYDYFFLKRDEVTTIDHHAITSGDPYLNYMDEPVPYNYHAHEGYLASSYDVDAITAMFQKQMATGTNLLTVRFENQEDYAQARSWENGGGDIGTILTAVGYSGMYYCMFNDDVRVVNVALYASE